MISSNWIAFRTIIFKETVRILRIWTQTLLPSAITSVLYFIIFGKIIGDRVGSMVGIGYIEFIAPGLILMAVITNSYGNVSSSFFSSKFQRNVEEMLVSPASEHVIILGYAAGGILRGSIVGLIVTVISMIFTKLQVFDLLIIVSMVLLTAMLFSLAGLVNALLASKFDDIGIIPTFILTPLNYLGGIFFSISMLPEFWQKVAALNPVLYMVNTFRYGFLGVSDTSITFSFVFLGLVVLALYLLSMKLFISGKGMRN
ncbi:MAG: ABC transporter permease [Leptospiraceae bacterium]|nr:ABC transporter permease [Leptospiraceae bacterium]MCB1199658.1 ABC transporter permease [Leptospiraceae bacterium]